MTDENEDGLKLFASNNEAKTPEAVKFIPEGEGKNGISPINVDHLKAKFTGLTKEELMKFANDPFWVRLRWFLFILFWLIWLLMLGAAIVIIIVTPKCREPSPLVWWERSPLYVLDTKKLISSAEPEANVIGILKSKIDYLKDEFGIESLLLKSVLQFDHKGVDEVLNFTNVDQHLDSVNTFQREIIEYANSKGVRILLGFSPIYSGKTSLFIRSEVGEDEYKDYYVWYPTKYTSKPDSPPNKWLSVYDTPAWEWDDKRKQFYLHQFNVTQPDLNYRNPAVVDFMSDVLKFWLKLGVKGFYLNNTEYLLEDKHFEDELVAQGDSGLNHKQYGFYRHTKTFELPENIEILKNWSEIIRNSSGILSVSGGVLDQKQIADFVLRPLKLHKNFTAADLNANITRWINAVSHPTWEWKCSSFDLKCITDSNENSLTIVSFLLPGVPVLHDSDEFKGSQHTNNSSDGKTTNSSQTSQSSPLHNRTQLIKKLIELRSLPAVSLGGFESYVINSTVFSFTRIKAGFPGYLVAWNLGSEKVTINFQNYIKTVPEDIVVVLKSDFLSNEALESRNKVPSTAIDIAPKTAVVFSFVPSLK